MAASLTSLYTGYDDPKELHYICPLDNLASIIEEGLLSRKKANRLGIQILDVSNSEVQERRASTSPKKKSPEKNNLHNYVNLYLNSYNRTLYKFWKKNKEMCVLRIHPKILEKKGCMIADRNASATDVKIETVRAFTFDQASSHILHDEASIIFSDDLTRKYGIEIDENLARQIKQAEVLVPSKIPSSYIKGIYVPNQTVKASVIKIFCFPEKVTIHPSLFFEDGRRYHQLDKIGDAPELSDTGVDSYEVTPSDSDSEHSEDVELKKHNEKLENIKERRLFSDSQQSEKSESETHLDNKIQHVA